MDREYLTKTGCDRLYFVYLRGGAMLRDWVKAVVSVLAAFLGVQSEANRRRDFSQGRFSVFVMAGIVSITGFLLMVYGLARLVLTILE